MFSLPLLALALWPLSTAAKSSACTTPCSSSCLSAISVRNYTVSGGSIDFCNVTLTYTHPGWNDTIHLKVWLPEDNWNGRFQGTGGSVYAGDSGESVLASGVASNYSTGETDTGHQDSDLTSTASWYRNDQGDINIPLLRDYASTAPNDLAAVGKQITQAYYGSSPVYSFWNGCSTGGCQGIMMAQEYPTAYNAIYAGSPAINFPQLSVELYWPQFVMNSLNHYPPSCVLNHFTDSVVKACDSLDGVTDGVISALDLCHFDPHSIVNQTVKCNGQSVTITKNDAEVVEKSWQGARNPDGSFLWYGVNPGSSLLVHTGTSCTGSATNCTGKHMPVGLDWIKNWILNDPTYDLSNITWSQYAQLFNETVTRYNDLIGTNNPDLSAFKAAGGKMITWHGLADPLIPERGTVDYYKSVEAVDPDVRNYYRFFEAPGVSHCGGGDGAVPMDPFGAVIDWFEKGIVPETLEASNGNTARNLCPYPMVSVFKGGDTTSASSYECESSWS